MPRNPETPRAARHKFTLLKNQLAASGTMLTEEDFARVIPASMSARNKSLAMNLLLLTVTGQTTKAVIGKMVALGVPKPDWVAIDEWEAKYPLLPSEKLICHLAAMGLVDTEIAKEADLSLSDVKTVLSFDRAQKKIDEIRGRDFKTDTRLMLAKIQEYLPRAIETAFEIMTDPEQKGSTRLAAAESFMDRALGKAAQKIEVEDSTIKDVLTRIDQLAAVERQKLLDDKTIDLKKEDECGTETDPVEKWVAANPL